MSILKKIKGLFKRECLSTLEIKEMFIPELEIRKDFRNQINYTSKNITIGDICLAMIKEHDPKATEILEAVLDTKSFGYNVKYLRDKSKESQK